MGRAAGADLGSHTRIALRQRMRYRGGQGAEHQYQHSQPHRPAAVGHSAMQ